MGSKLTHTVSGNVTSFRSADKTDIESLKVHFLPVLEGSGDPSPSNVKNINGWQEININKLGKNIGRVVSYTPSITDNPNTTYYGTSSYGTSLSINAFSLPDTPVVITLTEPAQDYSSTSIYRNGYFCVLLNNLTFGLHYDFSFKITNIIDNYFNKTLSDIRIADPVGSRISPSQIIDNIVIFKNILFLLSSTRPNESDLTIYNNGMSFTLSEFMVTPAGMNDGVFEPYCGSIIPITFPILGKNKFNAATIISRQYVRAGNITTDKPLGSFVEQSNWSMSDYISVALNTLYTLTIPRFSNAGAAGMVFYFNNQVGTEISGVAEYQFTHTEIGSPATYTFTTPKNCKYIRFSYENSKGDNCQLELGSSATTYEPYSSNNTVYGGYIDIAKGELVLEWNYITINKIQNKSEADDGYFWWTTTTYSQIPSIAAVSDSSNCYVNRLKTASNVGNSSADGYFLFSSNGIIRWKETNTSTMTKEEYSEYIAENPFYVCYKLATPITYLLTSLELKTFLNYNNIWSNTNNIIEVTYEVIDHLAQKRASIPKLRRKVLWNLIDGPMDADHWKPYVANRMNVSFSDGVADIELLTKEYSGYSVSLRNEPYPQVENTHIYYASYMVNPEYSGRFGLEFAGGKQYYNSNNNTANTWERNSFLTTATANRSGAKYLPFPLKVDFPSDTNPKFKVKCPIYIDLTKMFGKGQEPTLNEFENLCKLNHINLEEFLVLDLIGTELIWYIDDNDKNKYMTVEWNLWAPTINSSNYKAYNSTNITMTIEDDTIILTWNTISSGYSASICSTTSKLHTIGNKYYLSFEYQTSFDNNGMPGQVGGLHTSTFIAEKDTWCRCHQLITRTESGSTSNYTIYIGELYTSTNIEIGSTCKIRNPVAIDVTLLFGAGNEPSTTAEFEELCVLNGIDLTTYLPRSNGTKQIWRIR